jgi:hypothetical protein
MTYSCPLYGTDRSWSESSRGFLIGFDDEDDEGSSMAVSSVIGRWRWRVSVSEREEFYNKLINE